MVFTRVVLDLGEGARGEPLILAKGGIIFKDKSPRGAGETGGNAPACPRLLINREKIISKT